MAKEFKYNRILLKLSGEALMGTHKFGVDHQACQKIATSIQQIHKCGVQIGVVVGGGNIFRGAQAKDFGFARTPADNIGMLATTINGLVLQQSLAAIGCVSHVMSALECFPIVESYSWSKATGYLEKGEIVIFVGGTGNPYFTTDTAAALRASEIKAEILLKATKVDGVYDKDPIQFKDAKKHQHLSFTDVLSGNLGVMDATAVALCRENHIPIYVFNLFEEQSIYRALTAQDNGTLVT